MQAIGYLTMFNHCTYSSLKEGYVRWNLGFNPIQWLGLFAYNMCVKLKTGLSSYVVNLNYVQFFATEGFISNVGVLW